MSRKRKTPSSPQWPVRWVDKAAIVDVSGDIDLNRSLDFQQRLLSVLDERPERLVVNLADVSYMDSSGVASLVKVLSRARKSKTQFRLLSLQERVRSVFEITRLDTVFEIHDTQEEALA